MNDCCGWLQQVSVLGAVLPKDTLSHTGATLGGGWTWQKASHPQAVGSRLER